MNRRHARSASLGLIALLAFASSSAAAHTAGTTVPTSYQRLYPGTDGSRKWDSERQQLKDRAKARRERALSTDELLESLAAKARTPADHLALQGYFERLEQQYSADATAHVAMAGVYIGTRIAWAAAHCEQEARRARELARVAREAAAEQGRLAAVAR